MLHLLAVRMLFCLSTDAAVAVLHHGNFEENCGSFFA